MAEFVRECDCRKPIPGMILRAPADHGLSLPDSVANGRKPSYIHAARAAGVGSAFIVRADGGDLAPAIGRPDASLPGVAQAIQALLAEIGPFARVGDNRAVRPCRGFHPS